MRIRRSGRALAPGLALALLLGGSLACSRHPKGDAVVIVDEKGDAQVKGKVAIDIGADGQLRPNIRKAGNLMLFRAAQTLEGFSAKAGTIYRVNDKGGFDEVGTFDPKESSETLIARHLRK